MRRYVIACVLFVLVSVPLHAELKYTSKLTVRKVPSAPASTDMIGALLGPMMLQMFGGAEGVEMTVTLHEDGRMRTDYLGAFAGMPAGTVVIQRADGTSVGFDPKAQTWWKIDADASNPQMAAMLAQMRPQVTTKRTGEFETVAGLKAERVSMSMTMPLPVPEGADQIPPQMAAMIPKEITMDGDIWVSDAHAKYAKGMARMFEQSPMGAVGLGKVMGDLNGFSVRNVMRMSILAGYEMETLVSQVAEEDLPDSVFDVPPGFKEVPMPTPRIR